MGLINTPITFQAIINHILHDLLDNEILVYINNILIYIKTIEEYNRLVLDILEYAYGGITSPSRLKNTNSTSRRSNS